MFRTHSGGWDTGRQAMFALLPVVIGAGVLLGAGDGAGTGMSRLEATQSSVVRPLESPPVAEEEAAEMRPAVLVAGVSSETTAAVVTTVPPVVAAVTLAAAPPAAAAGTQAAGAGPLVVAADETSSTVASTPTAGGPATTVAPTTSSTTTSTTAPAPAPPAGRSRSGGAEAEVVPLTNADRVAAGLGPLSRNGCLDAVASGYAEQMARTGVLAHNAGVGPAVTGCKSDARWGDNVGMSTACDTAALEKEWMASPGHRRNILTGAFTRIGVGVWTDEKGTCWAQVLFSS